MRVATLLSALLLSAASPPALAAEPLEECLASRKRACLIDAVVAEALEREDPSDRISGLAAVAKLLAEAGDRPGALTILYNGEDAVAAMADDDLMKEGALVFLSQAYAEANAYALALNTADRIADEGQREFARSNVAVAAADAADIPVLQRLLPEANLQLGDELREALLTYYADLGDWNMVVEVSRQLVFWNPDVARWMGAELVARGYLNEALELRDRIDVIGLREFAVRGVIDGFIRRREYVIARHIAGQSQNPYHSDSALVDILTAMARGGDITGAEGILAQIKEGETRGDGMVRLATVLAERGQFEQALAIGRSAETDPPPARDVATAQRLPRLIYDAIARVQAARDAAGALATARRIDESAARNVTLEAIAVRRLAAGDQKTAVTILNELLAANPPVAPLLARDVVRDFASMFDVERAEAMAQTLRDPADRALTLLRAAPLVLEDRDTLDALLNAAERALAGVTLARQRDSANSILAVMRARGREADEAAKVLAHLTPGDRSRALLAIAFPRQQPLP